MIFESLAEMMTESEKHQFEFCWLDVVGVNVMSYSDAIDQLSAMRKYNAANPPEQIKLREKYTTGTKLPFYTAPKAN